MVKTISLFLLVRSKGLEPIPSRTRPSTVRVCLFRHDRILKDVVNNILDNITLKIKQCQCF